MRRRTPLGDMVTNSTKQTIRLWDTSKGRTQMALHHWHAAARAVARRRGLALAVTGTLGIGIGANSIIFSAVDAVLLKPLPYPDAGRLVAVYEQNAGLRQATQLVAPGRLEEWNERNTTFDGLAASYFENMTDLGAALPERVEAMRTSPRFFTVLGVVPLLGRWPTREEEQFGGPAVAVVSQAFWLRRLGADRGVIGRALDLSGTNWTIVGVMPPGFSYPTATTDVWLPTRAPATFLAARTARLYTTIGRLKPGVTIEQGTSDLDRVQARLGEQYPATDRGWGASLVPLKEQEVGGVRQSLWLLLGAVGLLLIATCANVACLLLADATRREHELSVRFALGASRTIVAGQLIREGVILAFAGSLVGLTLTWWGLPVLRRAAFELPRLDTASLDGRVIAFSLLVGAATTIFFAGAPALQATRREVAEILSRGGRARIGGQHLLQRGLVMSQVTLAILLLSGAGAFVRSYLAITAVNPGFDPANVLMFRISAQWSERSTAVVQRHARTIQRLGDIPGVESAAFAQLIPGGLDVPPNEFRIVGREAGDKMFSTGRAVSSGYFRTLRIPTLRGDTCSADPAAPPFSSALVTQSWADRFLPGEDPVGHELVQPGQLDRPARIVGMVGDVRESGLAKAPEPLIYWCGFNPYWPDPYFLLRTAHGHPATIPAIRAAVHEMDPDRAVYGAQALSDALSRTFAQQRLGMFLLLLFAGTAQLLASIGLYGVLSQLVASRRREIGVRLALGAPPMHVVRSVVAQAGLMTTVGLAAGVALAFAASRLLATMVYGVSPRDPLTLAAASAALLFVAALTALVPATRAGRVDPLETLRED
jgi:putative ABC transport system permease protein